MGRKTALYGVLTALAFILSYVESLVPIPLGIPGIKLGLANLVVFAALYLLGSREAFLLSMVRILLAGFTFGSLYSLLYSLAGGLLSFAVMAVCKKTGIFSRIGVSIAGGVSHNIGQICVAAVVFQSAGVFYYLPALLIAGLVCGALIGLLAGLVVERMVISGIRTAEGERKEQHSAVK